MRQFRIKTRWGITTVSFGLTYHFPDLHHMHENSAETTGPKCRQHYQFTQKYKNMIIHIPILFSGSRWTLLLKSHAFGSIRKLDVNQYIFQYTFNQTSAMTCELFSQSSFLWKIELCALSGAMLWLLADLLWLL